MKRIIEIIFVVGFFFLGYYFGRQSVEVVTTEIKRIDTVFYTKPEPIRTLPPTFTTVKIPCLLFVRDTIFKTIAVSNDADSIEIPVTIEHKEYGDSTYRAQVSGPRIGTLGPSLDWIETYNRTTIRQQTVTKRNRFAVTAGAGVGYTPQGIQLTVGVQVGIVLWQK